jgi:hypothetical protein
MYGTRDGELDAQGDKAGAERLTQPSLTSLTKAEQIIER